MRLHKDAKTELIRSIPLFAGCNAAEISEVAAIADELDLREGRHLTDEHADGREFVVIISGTAAVIKGEEQVNTLGPGEWFGEIAVMTGQPRTATVLATSDVHALVIEGHRFTTLLSHAPDIRAKIEKVMAERA
jgi:CRP-like cAMP-binding protein